MFGKKGSKVALYVFCSLMFLSGGSLIGQELSLTVEQAITTGLENSKSLHSSMMKTEYADAKSSEMNGLMLPSLRFGGSYTKLSEVPPFALGPYPPLIPAPMVISPSVFNNYNLRLTMQQPLFMGFRLRRSADMAEYSSDAAQEDYRKDRAELVYNIKNAYWNLYKLTELGKVIDENVAQVKSHLRDVQNFFNQGIVTKNEVLKVEVQLSNIEIIQIDTRNNTKLAMIALSSLIGIPLSTEINLASPIQTQERQLDELQRLITKAIEKRPDIKAMEYRVKAGESGVSMARAGWYPQIALVGNYLYARPNQRIFPTLDKFRDTWDVSLSMTLDIWNWGQTLHQTDQAQAQLAQAEDGLGLLRDGVTLEVTQSYLTFNQTKERISVAEKAISQAEENYRITNEKFKSGLALNSDLLDAETALMQAKFNHVQAMVDHELAGARLEKSIGENNP